MARTVVRGNPNSLSKEARKGYSVEGLKEIQQRIGLIVSAVTGPEIKAVYVEAAAIVAEEMRKRAPVRTGALRAAIFAGPGSAGKPNALVGVNQKKAPHAHLVEYGAATVRPQPFLRPAVATSGPAVAAALKSGLLKIIDKYTV